MKSDGLFFELKQKPLSRIESQFVQRFNIACSKHASIET
jgi:hypothetical protein